ncbi:MAG TPA: hypothetical protein VGI40_28050, partial [Pirellulaceae bacterium]
TLQLGYLDGEFKSPWMDCTLTTTIGTQHDSGYSPCFVSRVAGVHYLNLAGDIDMTKNQISEDASLLEKIHEYTILKYEIKDATLILTMVDENFLKKAIAAGTIKGEGTTVNARSADLASFLEKNHAQVFPTKEAVRFSPL